MSRRAVAAGVVAGVAVAGALGTGAWKSRAMPAETMPTRAGKPQMLFDDFAYADRGQLAAHGWIVRTKPGWPGVRGATWAAENVSFHDNPARPGDQVLRMSSSTDGTAAGTTQTQICHRRKYREGTYAARVRFRDAPASGPRGDQLVETFYAISPLARPMDPRYSELDFEYLPNGGWGVPGPILFVTTWETFRPEPNWIADNTSGRATGSRSGWHTLVLQVARGDVTYFLDGAEVDSHGGKYYPEVPMSINFNLWFIVGGLLDAGPVRRYQEDVDWVFHRAGDALSPQQVAAEVARLRGASVAFRDTVDVPSPRLRAPCNL
jgi:hypothetical protein